MLNNIPVIPAINIFVFFLSKAWKSDKKEAKKDIALGSSKVKDEHKAEEEDILYEYFDPGNHWCRMCNFISNNVYHLFDHLQTKRHMTVSFLYHFVFVHYSWCSQGSGRDSFSLTREISASLLNYMR